MILPFTQNFDTLVDARAWLESRLEEGDRCPCCGQYAKVYKRKLNSTMARSLIGIARYFKREDNEPWCHIPTLLVTSRSLGDAAKIAYWGLIEEKDEVRADGSDRAGYYRMTAKGWAFVNGVDSVPKHVFVYNQTVLGFSNEHLTIREALTEKFDYAELMGEVVAIPKVVTW